MGAEHILLWGLPDDRPLTVVREALEAIGCTVTFLDQRDVLHTEVELSVISTVEGLLRVNGQTIDLSQVSAVYLRPDDWRDLPALAGASRTSEAWRHSANVHDVLSSWADLTPALVINRPTAMAANGSKPYQASWIQSLGFKVPDTLITTDRTSALEFWRRHGRVIYKSLSEVRSIVSRLTEEHLARFDDIASCPTQFQQYIPGADYRVHVVGEAVFACRITSEADDYRYAKGKIEMQACQLPGDIAALSRKLADSMSLPVAGIDLRCSAEGDWYCFEVNPSPGFTYFEDLTGLPIAQAIVRLLSCGTSSCKRWRVGLRPNPEWPIQLPHIPTLE
jgi:RimK-like ATP-grasp domain